MALSDVKDTEGCICIRTSFDLPNEKFTVQLVCTVFSVRFAPAKKNSKYKISEDNSTRTFMIITAISYVLSENWKRIPSKTNGT